MITPDSGSTSMQKARAEGFVFLINSLSLLEAFASATSVVVSLKVFESFDPEEHPPHFQADLLFGTSQSHLVYKPHRRRLPERMRLPACPSGASPRVRLRPEPVERQVLGPLVGTKLFRVDMERHEVNWTRLGL